MLPASLISLAKNKIYYNKQKRAADFRIIKLRAESQINIHSFYIDFEAEKKKKKGEILRVVKFQFSKLFRYNFSNYRLHILKVQIQFISWKTVLQKP